MTFLELAGAVALGVLVGKIAFAVLAYVYRTMFTLS